jgi:NADH-quinone oxidoreductase subunit A
LQDDEAFMLIDYLPIIVLVVISTGLGGLVVIVGHILGPRRPTQRKSLPYESGMRPIGQGARRMPVRFYLVAVLFILFDIEVIFFLPWAVVFRQLGIFGLVEMLIFIAILLVGYVYAWKKGALEWE